MKGGAVVAIAATAAGVDVAIAAVFAASVGFFSNIVSGISSKDFTFICSPLKNIDITFFENSK